MFVPTFCSTLLHDHDFHIRLKRYYSLVSATNGASTKKANRITESQFPKEDTVEAMTSDYSESEAAMWTVTRFSLRA
ncbi:hypothetical protein SNOG_13223 [Parastagonospora nodorum SN15]|uniref:Uncharacterized protein n=1 Tax=Phaeosphaeria nodorum (strain SN15 / ATCC MYA-4574 / FGSC 10173) TaxID=321614 RepID=Q0U4U1_PHANO|nr:hypothetical protein SNOG_13223 [Parastagonospora nodorum SN15]EAT79550.1 hypothetical protein SNOG_13223 [Parastagonospora nodorum SN15]